MTICNLCNGAGERLVWQGKNWRVIAVDDPQFPVYLRLVHQDHVAEFSDLESNQVEECFRLMVEIEKVVRLATNPDKVNLAQFGNVVPHLHWHIIGRFNWDAKFPNSIWGPDIREADPDMVEQTRATALAAEDHLAETLRELTAAT